jgi:amidase
MSVKSFILSEATLPQIQRAFEEDVLSSESLARLYLNRIDNYDKKGPTINATLTINSDWLEVAEKLDQERKNIGPRGPLHGIPVVVKDNIDVFGMPTTGGFHLLKESYPARNSAVASRLNEAGALVLAKVNANDWFGKSPNCASTLGGQTVNPYNLEYTPGGSSCGTAAAVAANFAPLGLGTDTSGSVLMPAAHCGLFGMIPSKGLVSRAGVMPIAPTLGRVGAMARSPFDLAAQISCLIGWDPEDMTTNEALDCFPKDDFVNHLSERNLDGFRIGVLREMWPEDPSYSEASALISNVLETIKQAGAFIVDDVLTGVDLLEVGSLESWVSSATEYEMIPALDAYFRRLGPNAPFKTVAEIIDVTGVENLKGRYRDALNLPPPEKSDNYLACLKVQTMLRNEVINAIQRNNLDAVVLPYSLEGPSRIRGPIKRTNSLASHAGLPSLVAPAGRTTEGLPIALQFITEPYNDLALLQLAHLVQEANAVQHTLPEVTPSLPGEHFSDGKWH